jgi:dienelactone hydrolase
MSPSLPGRPCRVWYYPGIGHGFLSALADGSRDEHEPARESWRRTLEFFRRELGGRHYSALEEFS